MGYYSSFIMEGSEAAISKLREMSEDAAFCLEPNGDAGERAKWHDWQADMERLASAMPESMWHIRREGEDVLDVEEIRHQGGKIERRELRQAFTRWQP